MIENFMKSVDYENGYKKALSDVKNYIQKHSDTMKLNKLTNCKGFIKLLSAMAKYWNEMLTHGENASFVLTNEKEILPVWKVRQRTE